MRVRVGPEGGAGACWGAALCLPAAAGQYASCALRQLFPHPPTSHPPCCPPSRPSLQPPGRSKLAAFGGRPVLALVQAIKQERGFSRPPIGPVGQHLTLEDSR